MDKFFSVFGKAALILLVIGGIAYGAYTIGRSKLPSDRQFGGVSTTASPAPTDDPGLMPETVPSSVSGTPVPTTTVSAGLDNTSGLSFTKYQLNIPAGWVPSHKTTNEGTWVDTLVLTRGSAEITIFQAATGGALCLYPNDPDFEGPSSRYDTYVELSTMDSIDLRRSTTNAVSGTTKGFTVCQKGTDGSYGQPTVFGHMSIKTPLNPDGALLAEIDAIIASLKKI